MHVPYISTNNNHARLLIILDNIWSRYGLDTPNNYPVTPSTKGWLPTLSLECPTDPQFLVHLQLRCIRSCAVFSAQLDSAPFILLYCFPTVDYASRSLTQDSAARFPFLTALRSMRSPAQFLWTSFWFHDILFHFFPALRSIPQFSAAFDSIL